MTEAAEQSPTIVWFRDDLRLDDNPALHAAKERGAPILCVYVLESDKGLRPLGGASRWWLHHSLEALAASLEAAGARLDVFAGKAAEIIPALATKAYAGTLVFNRRYAAAAAKLDWHIDSDLTFDGLEVEVFNGNLLFEPWDIKTKAGGSYGVYTPYWKACLAAGLPDDPLPKPRKIDGAPYPKGGPKRMAIADLGLLPTKPDWAGGLREAWTPGEDGARARLRDFLNDGLAGYAEERNRLASLGTSRLSPHLRFGEISPRTIVAEVKATQSKGKGATTYLSEIGWREFDYHNLHYHPDVAMKNLHGQFDRMPWETLPQRDLERWRQGRTGFPVVDAGMRELWATGTMHNRVRMITASFLIKDLMCDWRVGEDWFWDTLCDADPANNAMNWQWVAGSGADAAPFFRIFNPVTQGEKFDPEGEYVRRWVPELAQLQGKAIHAPWTLDRGTLQAAGIELGKTYPEPMVDHKAARERALKAYEKIKG